MFDSVLRRETLPRRRFGAGAVLGVAAHVAIAALVVRAHEGTRRDVRRDVAITFVKAPPGPPAAPAARAVPRPRPGQQPRRAEPEPAVVPQPIVAPIRIPEERPPERDPDDGGATAPGVQGGDIGGEPGGAAGGVAGGPAPAPGPLAFDDRMTAPVKLSGPDPQYTDRAQEREVQGTMVVRCVVTTEGSVHGCRVLRGLPFMDRAVTDALERRRYRPATLAGRPVEVAYDFKITLRLR